MVEAIGRGPVLGVEWHPERDASAAAVYGWLVEEARRRSLSGQEPGVASGPGSGF